MNQETSNPKDYQVVSFHNDTDFRFTPEMGCMYSGRAINDTTGEAGIGAGVTMTVPYHIGHQLAINLAKVVMLKGAPTKDVANSPQGISLWSEPGLENLKNSFLVELYSEERPKEQSQAEMLIAKIAELNKLEARLNAKLGETTDVVESDVTSGGYKDKAEVIAELTKREIKFDARKNKAELEKLLVA